MYDKKILYQNTIDDRSTISPISGEDDFSFLMCLARPDKGNRRSDGDGTAVITASAGPEGRYTPARPLQQQQQALFIYLCHWSSPSYVDAVECSMRACRCFLFLRAAQEPLPLRSHESWIGELWYVELFAKAFAFVRHAFRRRVYKGAHVRI